MLLTSTSELKPHAGVLPAAKGLIDEMFSNVGTNVERSTYILTEEYQNTNTSSQTIVVAIYI